MVKAKIFFVSVSYQYNLGLPWTITVELMRTLQRDCLIQYPQCIAARGSNIIEQPQVLIEDGDILLKIFDDAPFDLNIQF